ncbi:MAG TPA: metallopeptidase family protein [Anaerolineae bacterium]|nr:metallopeptidase family protein [Anaerolineae bacterium]
MNRERFEVLVAEAIESLPPDILSYMDNVAVTVEWWPSPAALRRAGVSRRGTLFGLYEGVPLTQRGTYYGLVPPDKITIYQGPLEQVYRTPDTLREAVRRVVIHEIAHHFGISDERLRELGAY